MNGQKASDQVAYLTEAIMEQARTVVNTLQHDFKNADKQLKLAIIAELMNNVS
jgi:hypothetical protein